jgi:hypothetical protein
MRRDQGRDGTREPRQGYGSMDRSIKQGPILRQDHPCFRQSGGSQRVMLVGDPVEEISNIRFTISPNHRADVTRIR